MSAKELALALLCAVGIMLPFLIAAFVLARF
jgi:hypothetical protein